MTMTTAPNSNSLKTSDGSTIPAFASNANKGNSLNTNSNDKRVPIRKYALSATSAVGQDSGPSFIETIETATPEDSKTFPNLIRNDLEPNLFNLPSSLSPEYRPIPILTKIFIGTCSVLISMKWHLQSMPIMPGRMWPLKQISKYLLKFLGISLFSTLLLQETLFPPSRIDTLTLLNRKWLPSTFSNFSLIATNIPESIIQTNKNDDMHAVNVGPLGVHYLQYIPTNTSIQNTSDKNVQFDAIHFNHGFGASSLSWLPIIPSLSDKLKARVAIAHDAPGFGLTDRPSTFGKRNSLVPYASAGSAAIGNALVLNKIDYNIATRPSGRAKDGSLKKVALFGHSMGCASTLRMALSLPRDIQKVVVLVAPALLGPVPSSSTQTNQTSVNIDHSLFEIIKRQMFNVKTWLGFFVSALRNGFIDKPMIFFLKRLVA